MVYTIYTSLFQVSFFQMEGNVVTVLHLPRTKTNQITGEDMMFSSQSGPVNPTSEIKNHLRINSPTAQEHLFTYTSGGGKRIPLTRRAFLERLKSAALAVGVPAPAGHSFRIGGTLEYLLRGVPFESVKVMGRWKSDAFLVYLRRHTQTLAVFCQDRPGLQEQLIQLTLRNEPVANAAPA